MKKMTRRTFLAGSALLSASVLFGCGDKGASNSGAASTAAPSSGAAQEETSKPAVEANNTGLTEETLREYPKTDESCFDTFKVDGGVEITGCTSTDDVISIPETIGGETVVAIGKSAFMKAEYKGICLPDTVTTIGWGAFMMANAMEVVWLGSGLVTVGQAAFNDCQSLKTITFPESTTTFEGMVFSLSPKLERVYIPATVTTIPNNAILSQSGCPNVIIVTPEGSFAEAAAIDQEIAYENN